MKFEKKKNEHGWRWIITDEDTQERWSGNIERSITAAKDEAIKGFIRAKQTRIKAMAAETKIQKESLKYLNTLIKLFENEEQKNLSGGGRNGE